MNLQGKKPKIQKNLVNTNQNQYHIHCCNNFIQLFVFFFLHLHFANQNNAKCTTMLQGICEKKKSIPTPVSSLQLHNY